MINLIKVPSVSLTDFFEKARFALTWRICVLFSSVLFIITLITFLIEDAFFPHYLVVLLINIIGLIYIYRYKKYKFVSILICTGSTVAVLSSIIFVPNVPHIIEILWMMVVIIFSFFTLNKVWGSIFVAITVIVFVTYFNTVFFDNIEGMSEMKDTMKNIMSIEFIFAGILITYILYQFYDVSRYAETERKSAFENLKKEKLIVEQKNQEKTILLQEIHHRVKNNLQVIISLLRIQSDKLKSKEAIKSFNEAVNRIMTMSLIHQKMYEKDSLAKLHLEDYLDTLVNDIIRSSITNGKIEFTQNIEMKLIGTKTIVPFALIVNELVSNSLKHAFEKDGEITIEVKSTNKDEILFEYRDSGKWKKPTTGSFGLQLIDVFTEQLEGTFFRELTDAGTIYKFKFKNLDYV